MQHKGFLFFFLFFFWGGGVKSDRLIETIPAIVRGIPYTAPTTLECSAIARIQETRQMYGATFFGVWISVCSQCVQVELAVFSSNSVPTYPNLLFLVLGGD
jgi:uncharacterized membrane protein YeiH